MLVGAVEAVGQGEEHFRLLVDAVNDYALYTLDCDGHVTSWNAGAERIKGYKAEEILGKHVSVFYEQADVRATRPERELRLAAETGRYEEEGRRVRKDGSAFWANVIITTLRDADGRLRGFAKVTRDITERKDAELAFRIFTEKLERRNEELQEFAMIASHDLQEPLRKIQMFGDRLKEEFGDALGPVGQDYIDRMQNAGARGQTLIQGLLAYSRLTTQAQPLALVDLHAVATEVVGDLEARLAQAAGSIEIDSLPTLEADALQMRQLFQNLVGNALKFHRPGVAPKVRISATRIDGPGARDGWQIAVEDNGIGFDEKYLDRIFKMFQRLHERGVYEGSGRPGSFAFPGPPRIRTCRFPAYGSSRHGFATRGGTASGSAADDAEAPDSSPPRKGLAASGGSTAASTRARPNSEGAIGVRDCLYGRSSRSDLAVSRSGPSTASRAAHAYFACTIPRCPSVLVGSGRLPFASSPPSCL